MKAYLAILVVTFIFISSGPASGYHLLSDFQNGKDFEFIPIVAYKTGTPIELAESSPAIGQKIDSGENIPSIGSYARGFFPDLLHGTERIFSRDNIPLAAIGFGTAALALTVDRRVSDYFKRSSPLGPSWMNAATDIGYGYIEIGVGAALVGTGELINDKKIADAGVVSLEAFLINGAFTEGLKYMTQRSRPNRGNKMSFPAGHASVTAAFSASISEMYDWNPWLAVPLYVTTAYVGVSRIQAQEHYLSDVIAGITLGTLVGSSVGKYHKEKDAKTGILKKVSIFPLYEKDFRGCLVMLQY
jgi:membrane-associated phospholipid phosphatase